MMLSGDRAQRDLGLGAGPDGPTWTALVDGPLPVQQASQWAVQPACGAVVTFLGTVRDHSADRAGVTALTYEAYEEYAALRLRAVAEQTRKQWPDLGRLVALHRVGRVGVTDPAVVVVAAAAHRDIAFAAARFLIDTVKDSVPLWKKEHWPEGEAWAEPCTVPSAVGTAGAADVGVPQARSAVPAGGG